jgi:hypothetical protein
MLKPHNHTEDDADLVTYHAKASTAGIARHLEAMHGYTEPVRFSEIRQRHAEEHATALSPEDQGRASETEKRDYAAALLRRLAKDRLGELDHVHLPWQDESVSIVSTDAVESWLYGLATRVENGADL